MSMFDRFPFHETVSPKPHGRKLICDIFFGFEYASFKRENAKFNFLPGGNNWWANIDPRVPRIKLSCPLAGRSGKTCIVIGIYLDWSMKKIYQGN